MLLGLLKVKCNSICCVFFSCSFRVECRKWKKTRNDRALFHFMCAKKKLRSMLTSHLVLTVLRRTGEVEETDDGNKIPQNSRENALERISMIAKDANKENEPRPGGFSFVDRSVVSHVFSHFVEWAISSSILHHAMIFNQPNELSRPQHILFPPLVCASEPSTTLHSRVDTLAYAPLEPHQLIDLH